MMNTEEFCASLAEMDPTKAIRAIHEAWCQLDAIGRRSPEPFDNGPALDSLAACLKAAGHIGFTD